MNEPSLTGHWGNRDSDDFLYQIAFDFVAHLSDLMESKGIGRTELAETLGVSRGRVSQILNDPGNLTLKIVVEYAKAIGYKAAIVAYDDSGTGNNGPVNPQIFTTCWEKLGRPTDLFQVGMAVASTSDPVDKTYALEVCFPSGSSVDPWKGKMKMLKIDALRRSGARDAGTHSA